MIIDTLKRLLRIEHEIESREYRREMLTHFLNKKWPYHTRITSVRVYWTREGTVIRVETHVPGLLIGRKGSFVHGLVQYLEEALNEEVKIEVTESDLWT